MPSSFSNLKIHIVFGTKLRSPWISETWEAELFRYIGGIVGAKDCVLEAIGGMPDHVHLLVGLRADLSVAELMRLVKANSSKWINDHRRIDGVFAWQAGYAAFSVSQSGVEDVRRYIHNQKEHHRERSFEQEVKILLGCHGFKARPAFSND